jgi:hypothetical protein
MIDLEPTGDYPVPYDTSDEKPKTFRDEMTVAANTADLLQELGATIDLTPDDLDQVKSLTESHNRKKASTALRNPSTASAAALFLKSYANQVAADANEVRSAITAKLMEIANCGDPKFELKALELLGKHSDIGLFTERSEITITHRNSDTLEAAIKERIKRLLNSDVVDVTPLADSLDIELGVADASEATAEEMLSELDEDYEGEDADTRQ